MRLEVEDHGYDDEEPAQPAVQKATLRFEVDEFYKVADVFGDLKESVRVAMKEIYGVEGPT